MMNRAYSILDVKAVFPASGIKEDQRIFIGTATTPEPDRIGDIVEPLGVSYKNPLPLLHHHKSDQPVGTVTFDKPTEDGITFKAKIPHVLEPGPLKDRVDTAWAEVRAGLVRGVSIGFRALEHTRLKDGGIRFVKSEVVELSLVSIPANQSATIHAIKSLDTAQRAAPGQSHRRAVYLNPPGATGRTQSDKAQEGTTMKTIAEQITALENKRAASAARMDTIMQTTLDEDRTTNADEQDEFDRLSGEVDAVDKDLVRLRQVEKTKAVTAKAVTTRPETLHEGAAARGGIAVSQFAVTTPRIEPRDHVWRSLVCAMKAHFSRQSPYEVLKAEYGDDELTRAVLTSITKSATVPADTVTSGWASQLVATSIQDFFAALLPNSVYPALAARGGKFSFGRSGIVSMPTRAATPTIAGSFVAQGAPIPVRQGAFSAITFTPKKMAVIKRPVLRDRGWRACGGRLSSTVTERGPGCGSATIVDHV